MQTAATEILEVGGLRWVHQHRTTTRLIHAGFVLDVGSRDELPGEEGLAHFWEHMAFKGTGRRRAHQISSLLESVGGELNAYTTKEKVFFYASCLAHHVDRAVDVLADITFHSTFPEREIQRERGVILEEMSMYRDDPEDCLFDDFDEMIFAGHPLGHNILGEEKTVKSFDQQRFLDFLGRHMVPGRIAFSSVGNVTSAQLRPLLEKALEGVVWTGENGYKRQLLNGYVAQDQVRQRPMQQSLTLIGGRAYGYDDERRIATFLLFNWLGGPATTSQLNRLLRERNGLVYSVEASASSFTDGGQFHVFFGTEPRNLNKAMNIVQRSLREAGDKPLGRLQLHRLKEQTKGQLAMSEERNSSLMQAFGKSLLDKGRIETLAELFAQIDAIETGQLAEVARDLFAPEKLSRLHFAPTD